MDDVGECSAPSRYAVPAQASAADDAFERAARFPDQVAFARKSGGAWALVTSKEFAEQVSALAAGLIAAGIQPGDRIALMSATRYEWVLCDFAIWTAGAVTVPVYETSSVPQVAWILSDSGAVAAFTETEEYRTTVARANVAPAFFEDRLRAHWLIDQVVLVGDQLPFVGALLTLDLAAFADWKREHRKPDTATVADLGGDDDLLSAVQAAIDEVNREVSRAESIRKFRIVAAEFTVSEELTPTQKVRRDYVLAKFAAEVQAMYQQPAASRS